jgi:cyclase
MLRHRVIPVLLLQNDGLVKTNQFDSSVYLGDPINAINIFNDKEVDELIFLDIDATKYNKSIDFELIKNIAQECFMPFAYGGGIKTIEEIEKLFQLGVEKIIINNSLKNKQLISNAVERFGSQSIVASVDIKKDENNNYQMYSYLTKQIIKYDILEYIKELERLNIGEIFVNNVDADGMMNGYDIKLMKLLSSCTNIPMIACGGAGNLKDLKQIINNTNISAVGAGSLFVFYGIHNAVLITYPKYEDLERLMEDNCERV